MVTGVHVDPNGGGDISNDMCLSWNGNAFTQIDPFVWFLSISAISNIDLACSKFLVWLIYFMDRIITTFRRLIIQNFHNFPM